MKIILTLLLFHHLHTIKRKSPYCKKDLVESYNLTSYNLPQHADFYVCPNLNSSCCSIYDQYHMFTQWKEVQKPRMIQYHDEIKERINDLRDMVSLLKDIDMKEIISHKPLPVKVKALILRRYEIFQKQDIVANFINLQ